MRGKKWITAGILAAVSVGWLYLLLAPEPTLPIALADGTYENACCGTLKLDRGVMSVAGQTVQYVIQEDKGGAYVLPAFYVGIVDKKSFDIDHSETPLKLRLDDPSHPRAIEISGEHETFSFSRRAS